VVEGGRHPDGRGACDEGDAAMTWTAPDERHIHSDAACAFCGSRAPEDPDEMREAGWQVRNDYPVKFRCPNCRQRQDRETVAA
jgi:rubredoxin